MLYTRNISPKSMLHGTRRPDAKKHPVCTPSIVRRMDVKKRCKKNMKIHKKCEMSYRMGQGKGNVTRLLLMLVRSTLLPIEDVVKE
jgi:hypothetical protein